MINESKLTELAIRVMSDPYPWSTGRPDAAYLVAQTRDNENSVLDRHCGSSPIGRLVVSNNIDATEEMCGYAGASVWMDKLDRSDIDIPTVESFDVRGPANTLTELTAMVNYIKEKGWKKIIITATPFHQLRAFITVVSVLLKEYPELKVYNQVGCPLDWNEPMKHSQNEPSAKRSDVIAKEIRRIHTYHEKGDLVDAETVLAYLDWRDSA